MSRFKGRTEAPPRMCANVCLNESVQSAACVVSSTTRPDEAICKRSMGSVRDSMGKSRHRLRIGRVAEWITDVSGRRPSPTVARNRNRSTRAAVTCTHSRNTHENIAQRVRGPGNGHLCFTRHWLYAFCNLKTIAPLDEDALCFCRWEQHSAHVVCVCL